MDNISFPILLATFFVSAIVTWLAGVTLTKTTSTLDTRFKLGDALGGLLLLGISGSLPEIAICLSAARDGHTTVILGNLLGGLAIQTFLIVFFDLASKNKKPLSFLASAPILTFEVLLTISLTVIAVIGTTVPVNKSIFHINPFSIVIVATWFLGIMLINRARKIKRLNQTDAEALPGRRHHERRKQCNHAFYAKKSNLYVISIFIFGCIATLMAGVVLERSGSAIAGQLGISKGIFAATAIAFVASLPELSTGLESIFIGDNHLAISDIMGGNAFMLNIFLVADIVSQKPILSFSQSEDIFFAVLGILMMGVYGLSFIIKSRKSYFRLGLDSIAQIVIYIGGLITLSIIK